MKTIHSLLILGLLIPNFAFAYDLPEDIVVNKSIVSGPGDSILPLSDSEGIVFFARGWLSGTNLGKYLAFWCECSPEISEDDISASPLFIHNEIVTGQAFTIDCVRNL